MGRAPGHAPVGTSKALSHFRGPRTTSKSSSPGAWFRKTSSGQLLRPASGSLEVARPGPHRPYVPVALGGSWHAACPCWSPFLEPAGPAAGPTPLPLQPELLAGPPVPSQCQQSQLLLLFLHHLKSLPRPPRSFQYHLRRCQTFKIGWKTWKTLCFLPWRTRWWIFWVLLHPSRLWVLLFLCGLWAQMRCGCRAPLVTEHHHGLRISPGQRERTVAPGPGAPQVIRLCPVETGGHADDLTVFCHCLTAFHLRPNGWEPWAIAHSDAHILLMSVGAALVPSATMHSLLLMTVIVAISLLHVVGPGQVPPSLIVHPRLAWPGDPLGTCRSHQDAVHLLHRHSNHPGAVVRPLATCWNPPLLQQLNKFLMQRSASALLGSSLLLLDWLTPLIYCQHHWRLSTTSFKRA